LEIKLLVLSPTIFLYPDFEHRANCNNAANCNFRKNELSLQSLFADELQKRVLEYHVKNKKNEKTSFRRLYGVWATVHGMPYCIQHC
jgi:hypothetical protein